MTVAANVYNSALQCIADRTVNAVADTLKVMLLDNSADFDATHTVLADISAHQIAAGNGYTSGGVALTGVAWGRLVDVTFLDASDPTWLASGGTISAYKAVIYDDSIASPLKPLLTFINLGGQQNANAGTQFRLIFGATGFLTITPVN